MAFTPEECLQLIADFTPHLKPALVESMDPAQSASIRKSSAVFVFPNESTNWVFERLGKAIREINDTVYGFDVSEFREGFQFTRYEVGEYYGPHFDIGPGKLTERKLSLTVQLSAPEIHRWRTDHLSGVCGPQGSGIDDSVPVVHVSRRPSGEDRRSLLAGELAGGTAVQISPIEQARRGRAVSCDGSRTLLDAAPSGGLNAALAVKAQ